MLVLILERLFRLELVLALVQAQVLAQVLVQVQVQVQVQVLVLVLVLALPLALAERSQVWELPLELEHIRLVAVLVCLV